MATRLNVAPLSDEEISDLRREFNLTPALGGILALLLVRRCITEADLIAEGITADGSAPKVEIMRLRKRVNPFGVKVLSMRNMGYWLTDATKEEILSKLPTRVS